MISRSQESAISSSRRRFLGGAAGLLALPLAGCVWPEQGLLNPCKAGVLPADLAAEPLVRDAWRGVPPQDVWDSHVHLFGDGASDSGIWLNPSAYRITSPMRLIQRRIYENAACVDANRADADGQVVARLVDLLDGMRLSAGAADSGQPKAMLFAFDWFHDAQGKPQPMRSTFHVPNAYAAKVAARHPRHFEWVASIHPFRPDAVTALEEAVGSGACAIKWLPSAMGIDPGSPRCDRFYAAAAQLSIPIISHAGEELAVEGSDQQHLSNPLRLRRALDAGVRVVVAHCASLGTDIDLDQGDAGPRVDSFTLFARMMDEPRYSGLLRADISALPQINRTAIMGKVIERNDWHSRLLNGSDYPLPGVMPLFSVKALVENGWLPVSAAPVLMRIREHNALLFDFVLKRTLRVNARAFDDRVFSTRAFFDRKTRAADSGRNPT